MLGLLACTACSSCSSPASNLPTAPSRTGKYRDAWRYIKARPAQHAKLLDLERDLTSEPAEYATRRRSERFYPQGLYYDPRTQTAWVYSRAHTEQRGFQRLDTRAAGLLGSDWHLVATRTGPLDTRRCIALRDRDLTLCLGLMHKGGLRAYGSASFRANLPERGGFRDFAVDNARARIYIIDSYLDALVTLDLSGQFIAQMSLVPGAYRIRTLDDTHLLILASNQPRLTLLKLDADGLPGQKIGIHTVATIRDAAFEPTTGRVWTAGYRQARVRRRRGHVENLHSFVYAYRLDDLALGVFVPVVSKDLSRSRLTDPVSVEYSPTGMVIALSGSHRVARLAVSASASTRLASQMTGLVPNAVLAVDDVIFTAGFLSGQLWVHDARSLRARQVIALDGEASRRGRQRAQPYELGEMLFYSKALWSDQPDNQFTCNSCHWDGLSDHRMHPGFNESRWEQIRPAAGAGMLAPIFTPGQASSLTIAVQGFIKSLDTRFFASPTRPVWFESVAVALDSDISGAMPHIRQRAISTFETRRALLTYLARRPVAPGYLRAPGQPFSASAARGARLFFRDCTGCHAPVVHMARNQPMTEASALRYLVDRPLAFADARLEKAGVLPYFTASGNRIAPLTHLARPGPFFSDGSAPTLRAVLRRSNPHARLVHAPENRALPAYDEADRADLLDFLLSL